MFIIEISTCNGDWLFIINMLTFFLSVRVWTSYNVRAGSQYDAKQCVALRHVAFASTLVGTHRDARIDSDPIFAFLCVGSLRLIAKKSLKILVRKFCVSRINATQGLASLREPALKLELVHIAAT